MKRFAVVALLVSIVAAAIFAIKNIGLFGRPTPHLPGFGNTQMDSFINPGIGPPGTIAGVPMISLPGYGDGPPAMSQRQINQVLADWTYPRGVDITDKYLPPAASPEVKAKEIGQYTRVIDVYRGEAQIFCFYALKSGIKPLPKDYFLRIVQRASANDPPSEDPNTILPAPIESETYSKQTKNYLIQASVTHPTNQLDTRIILQFAPRTIKPAP